MNQKLLSVAKGETPADLVIRNGKVVNVYSGEIYDGGVAICGDTIAAVGDVEYCIGEGTRVVDAEGKYLTPGFLENSASDSSFVCGAMLSIAAPRVISRCVLCFREPLSRYACRFFKRCIFRFSCSSRTVVFSYSCFNCSKDFSMFSHPLLIR